MGIQIGQIVTNAFRREAGLSPETNSTQAFLLRPVTNAFRREAGLSPVNGLVWVAFLAWGHQCLSA